MEESREEYSKGCRKDRKEKVKKEIKMKVERRVEGGDFSIVKEWMKERHKEV